MLGTRVTLKEIGAGLDEIYCPRSHGGCGEEVRFNIQIPRPFRRQVVCNIYWNGRWNRVEQFHLLCYLNAGEPYGSLVGFKDEEIVRRVLAGQPMGALFSQLVRLPLSTA